MTSGGLHRRPFERDGVSRGRRRQPRRAASTAKRGSLHVPLVGRRPRPAGGASGRRSRKWLDGDRRDACRLLARGPAEIIGPCAAVAARATAHARGGPTPSRTAVFSWRRHAPNLPGTASPGGLMPPPSSFRSPARADGRRSIRRPSGGEARAVGQEIAIARPGRSAAALTPYRGIGDRRCCLGRGGKLNPLDTNAMAAPIGPPSPATDTVTGDRRAGTRHALDEGFLEPAARVFGSAANVDCPQGARGPLPVRVRGSPVETRTAATSREPNFQLAAPPVPPPARSPSVAVGRGGRAVGDNLATVLAASGGPPVPRDDPTASTPRHTATGSGSRGGGPGRRQGHRQRLVGAGRMRADPMISRSAPRTRCSERLQIPTGWGRPATRAPARCGPRRSAPSSLRRPRTGAAIDGAVQSGSRPPGSHRRSRASCYTERSSGRPRANGSGPPGHRSSAPSSRRSRAGAPYPAVQPRRTYAVRPGRRRAGHATGRRRCTPTDAGDRPPPVHGDRCRARRGPTTPSAREPAMPASRIAVAERQRSGCGLTAPVRPGPRSPGRGRDGPRP